MKPIAICLTAGFLILSLAGLFASCTSPAPDFSTEEGELSAISNPEKAEAASGNEDAPEEEGRPSASVPVGEGKTYYEILMEEIAKNDASARERDESEAAKETALQRYRELETELADFDASHDPKTMKEEDYVKRVAITDEMDGIYSQYMAEPRPIPSDEELLRDYLVNEKIDALVTIDLCRRQLEKQGLREENPDRYDNLKDEIERNVAEVNFIILLEKEYREGESPLLLLRKKDRFLRHVMGSGDWKELLEKEPYYEEVWNGGEMIETGTEAE